MSYIVIPVYDFACDHDGCSQTIENVPHQHVSRAHEPMLTIAHRLLRKDGWTARRNASEKRWEHYCPEHSPACRKEAEHGGLNGLPKLWPARSVSRQRGWDRLMRLSALPVLRSRADGVRLPARRRVRFR